MALAESKVMMGSHECRACRYWKGDGASPYESFSGDCRRNAPRVLTETHYDSLSSQTRFPRTEFDAWCGEFQAREGKGNGRDFGQWSP